MVEPGTGPQLISEYDALVLPTYYDTEGHPGVLIEAMHAGVPVISTQVRTFPELVTNGSNGFLVPTKKTVVPSQKQLNALLAVDPTLMKKYGRSQLSKRP